MKMDRKLISKEPWELDYMNHRFGVSKEYLLSLLKIHENSRRKIYKALETSGYKDSQLTIKEYENRLQQLNQEP